LGGEMYAPQDVTTDSSGNVYVADTSNNRIQKFDSQGHFISTWGKGVLGGPGFELCTVAQDCFAGSTGTLGGEFNAPAGVGTDSAGALYVADRPNNRIQKFAADPVPPPTTPSSPGAPGPTGQRGAALKKCKKKKGASARRKCKQKANKLPI